MKTLVIYMVFKDEDEDLVERERKNMMEGIWDSDVSIHTMHEYRKATVYETEEYEEVFPEEEE